MRKVLNTQLGIMSHLSRFLVILSIRKNNDENQVTTDYFSLVIISCTTQADKNQEFTG